MLSTTLVTCVFVFATILGTCLGDQCPMTPGWNLVLKASRGNGQSVFDLWTSNRYTVNPTPLQTALNSLCGCHFKSELVEKWSSLPIKRVAISLYDQSSPAPVVTVIFDGTDTNKSSWFTRSRVLSSSRWSDLKTAGANFFSLVGDPRYHRRFFMNSGYGGCPEDVGWMVVHDNGLETCPWENHDYWPTFLYAKPGARSGFQTPGNLGQADVYSIWILM